MDNVSVATDAQPNADLAYTENDGAVVVDATINIEDIDDSNIESAIAQITGNFVSGEDLLSFVDQNGISGVFNSTNGTLSLTGSATVAEYETAIRSITYTNTSEFPDTTTRTVSFTVNDGDTNSNTQTRDIDLTAVNDAPVALAIEGTALSYTENDGAVAVTSTISFSDVDDTDIESAVVQFTAGYNSSEDVLSFADQNGISGVYNAGSGSWALTGPATLAEYETAIRSITYTNSSEAPDTTTRTVSITVHDGDTNSNTLTRDIAVTSVNDSPVVGINTGTSLAEGGSVTITTVMLNEADVDDAGLGLTYTVTSGPTNGQLELTTNVGVAITSFSQDDIDNNRVVFVHDGTQSAVDAFDFSLADGGEDGATPAIGTFNFTVSNVNDAPVALAIEGTALSYTENDGAAAVTSTISFSDVDDTDIESAVVQFTAGYNSSEDVLSFADQNGISGVYNAGSGSWALTGPATLAEYETAIRSITFTNSSEAPRHDDADRFHHGPRWRHE